MMDDTYFEIFWIDRQRDPKGRFVIQLSKTDSEKPGSRIEILTQVARSIELQEGTRLRTRPHVSAPTDISPVQLSDYLWSDGRINEDRLRRHLQRTLERKKPHLYQLQPGVPVLGDDLVDREAKIEEMISYLHESSCHLRAPRRYGSSMRFLDVLLRESMSKPTVREALAVLPELSAWPVPEISRESFLLAFKELKRSISDRQLAFLEKVLSALGGAGTVLLVDEFSVFLRALDDHPGEALDFLDVFKRARVSGDAPLRCMLAGSSGLSAFIELKGLDAQLNDLEPVDVPPIDTDAARILVEELFYGAGKVPSPDVVERVIQTVGAPIPYFLHALVHQAVAQSGTNTIPTVDTVDRAYRERLLGPQGNFVFRDFLLRARAYPKGYQRGAAAILRTLARADEPAEESELRRIFFQKAEAADDESFRRMMTCIEEDYDLVLSDERWSIRSKVLAERWRLGDPWLTE